MKQNTNTIMKKVQSIGVILMLVFPVCLVLTMLCSDYRTENEYNQYLVISNFLINWYTFTTSLVGMLLYSIGWFELPQKKNRPTTF